MLRWISAICVVLCMILGAGTASAQGLSALAKLKPENSVIADDGAATDIALGLTQPVPWRVRVFDGPPRMVIDVREVDWSGLALVPDTSARIVEKRAGIFRQGWSRLVMELSGPMVVETAELNTAAPMLALKLRLRPATAAEFAKAASLPEPEEWALPARANLPVASGSEQDAFVVVLDPGHGGIDPGAERDGLSEANLVLTFARELKELLRREGQFDVVLTRQDDVFVPLEERISIARAVGADVFISLHADAIAEGEAVGATLYTLSDDASDEASRALAERHDRDDLLSGIDLSAQDDLVANVLMDMARTETKPRIDRLAAALEVAIKSQDIRMHRHPHQTAGFSVLKSPDIPSILVELGFMSSARDLARLQDADWRARMAIALRDGLLAWAEEDAALSSLRRQ